MSAPEASDPLATQPPLAPTPPAPSDIATAPAAGPAPGAAVPRPPLPRRYELKRLLGEGGMGDVWLARDRRLHRLVAVKVMQARWAEHENALHRFADEAQLTSQLQHPGIPPVYETGTLPDGRPYFCMKVVRGRTLAALLARRADPADDLPRLLGIFEQVCQAVAYAHSKGVIHRDLKPQNVMVGAFGEVQVMDWGLAKVLKDQASPGRQPRKDSVAASVVETDRSLQATSLTQAGAVLGTFAYMPPEQARGEVDHLDRRGDVFGLGAMLCEILTGKPPYEGSREEVRLHAQLGFTEAALKRLAACPADSELTALARACLARRRPTGRRMPGRWRRRWPRTWRRCRSGCGRRSWPRPRRGPASRGAAHRGGRGPGRGGAADAKPLGRPGPGAAAGHRRSAGLRHPGCSPGR